MLRLPMCTKCGQSEEFMVSEDEQYICVCGHQFRPNFDTRINTLPEKPKQEPWQFSALIPIH